MDARSRRHLLRFLIGLTLIVPIPMGADDAVPEAVTAVEAADSAADLKDHALATRLDLKTEADATLQAHIDQIAAVASVLDAEIRDDKAKGDTQALYLELRRIRLDVLELVKTTKVQLPPDALANFEQLLGELDRYYNEP